MHSLAFLPIPDPAFETISEAFPILVSELYSYLHNFMPYLVCPCQMTEFVCHFSIRNEFQFLETRNKHSYSETSSTAEAN